MGINIVCAIVCCTVVNGYCFIFLGIALGDSDCITILQYFIIVFFIVK